MRPNPNHLLLWLFLRVPDPGYIVMLLLVWMFFLGFCSGILATMI